MMSDAQADYGFDAPHVPAFEAIAAGLTLLLGIAELATASAPGWWWLLVAAVLGFFCGMALKK